MKAQDKVRLGKALRMAKLALQAFAGVDFADADDAVSDAHRSLEEAIDYIHESLAQ